MADELTDEEIADFVNLPPVPVTLSELFEDVDVPGMVAEAMMANAGPMQQKMVHEMNRQLCGSREAVRGAACMALWIAQMMQSAIEMRETHTSDEIADFLIHGSNDLLGFMSATEAFRDAVVAEGLMTEPNEQET